MILNHKIIFRVDFDKFDFARNDTLDTILYSPTRTYFFQSDKSKGKEEDLVTYVNVMFLVSWSELLCVSVIINKTIKLPTIDGVSFCKRFHGYAHHPRDSGQDAGGPGRKINENGYRSKSLISGGVNPNIRRPCKWPLHPKSWVNRTANKLWGWTLCPV